MGPFRRGDDELGWVERELRERRPEPSSRFVRTLSARLDDRPRWFEPRTRYVLVGLLGAAVLAAAASAGGLSLATTSAHNAIHVVDHLTGSTGGKNDGYGDNNNKGNNGGNNYGDKNHDHGFGFPGPPGIDQYKLFCGASPHRRCTVEVEPDHVSIFEGDFGVRAVTFLVTLNGLSDGTVTVNWNTHDGTATTADSDYNGASGTLSFGFGQIAKLVTVYVNGDKKVEPDETFYVDFSSSTATIDSDDTQVSVTILNDDHNYKPIHH